MSSAANEATRQIIVAFARRRPLAGGNAAGRGVDAALLRLPFPGQDGYGVALVPESAARYYARPGITYRPVTGVGPSQVGVAWPPANDTNPVVQDFIRCCLASRTNTAEPT